MNIGQAFKMAWKSIWGKKGRSALTILSIFIGIAAVMTIVSIMEGMKAKSMEQFEIRTHKRLLDIINPRPQTVEELKKLKKFITAYEKEI